MTIAGTPAPLTRREVRRAAAVVAGGERLAGTVSVTFVGPRAMSRLNLAWKGREGPTDVLAFALARPDGGVDGDVYVCPAVARVEARDRRIALRRELLRLVVHGVLHVAGHDHPEGPGRTRSPMWRRQERYLACLG